MNYSTYRFTLDIHKARSQVSIPVMYQDTWVQLFINLTDGGKPYKIEEGCKAVLFGKKADGTALVNDCEIIDNTRIVYTFNEQTASCIGSVGCEIRLYSKDGLQLTTPSFAIWVEERVIKDDEIIESESEKSAIDRILGGEAVREEAMEALESRVAECEKKVGQVGADNSQQFEKLKQDVAEMATALGNKVDKVKGKSLVADSEIERLASVHNYDDTAIKESLAEYDSKVAAALDNSKKYTDDKIDTILGEGASDALDGIAELASALGEDKNFAATMATELAKKADAATMASDIARLDAKIGTGSGSGSGGSNYDDTEIKNDLATLMAWMNESNYVPLKFTTSPYVSSGSLYAVGQSVSSVTVKWAFNKTPETLTINGVPETNTAITSKTFALSTPITHQNTSNNKWTIIGSVTKPNGSKDEVMGTTSAISFGSYVISGYTDTKTYSASVHAPADKQTTSTLKTSRPTSFTGTGKGYIYLFFPQSFGKPTGYKYNGLAYKFDEIASVTFTNKHGVVGQPYYYCRTTEALTSESRTLTIEY